MLIRNAIQSTCLWIDSMSRINKKYEKNTHRHKIFIILWVDCCSRQLKSSIQMQAIQHNTISYSSLAPFLATLIYNVICLHHCFHYFPTSRPIAFCAGAPVNQRHNRNCKRCNKYKESIWNRIYLRQRVRLVTCSSIGYNKGYLFTDGAPMLPFNLRDSRAVAQGRKS